MQVAAVRALTCESVTTLCTTSKCASAEASGADSLLSQTKPIFLSLCHVADSVEVVLA
jgi:hypothetical protein